MVKGLLGSAFQGVLCSDFLGSYNIYDGPHQRCWVHLLGNLHELKEKHFDHVTVVAWVEAVRHLYDEALEFVRPTSPPGERERQIRYCSLLARLQRPGRAHARSDDHPCSTLAKRLLRHQDEMFQFVLHPAVSADNNPAGPEPKPLRGVSLPPSRNSLTSSLNSYVNAFICLSSPHRVSLGGEGRLTE